MIRALFLSMLAVAGLAAPAAMAKTLVYDFAAPAGETTCLAAGADFAGSPRPRDCGPVEVFSPKSGAPGIVQDVTVSPDATGVFGFGTPPFTPTLNIDSNGIGIGPETPLTMMDGSVRGSRIAAGQIDGARFSAVEEIRLSWDVPVSLTQFTIRSAGPSTTFQSLRILDDATSQSLTVFPLQFQTGNVATAFTTFVFDTPLIVSSFRLQPVFTLESDLFTGFWLTEVHVEVVPVPPALPLLGGAIALLAWRARSARRAAFAA